MPKMAGVSDMPKSFDLCPCSSQKKRRFGHKRKRIEIPSLPKEIIFKILLYLPADIIYNVMRYVCREWYNIIKDPIFIDAHLQESCTGILVRMCSDRYSTLCVKMGKHGIEISDLNLSKECLRGGKGLSSFWHPSRFLLYLERRDFYYCPEEALKFPGTVLASCRGLILVADKKFQNCVHVANPVSKQWVKLPPLNVKISSLFAGIAYAASCKECKVAYTYCSGDGCFLEILTLGVDSAWRCITSAGEMCPIVIRKSTCRCYLRLGLILLEGIYIGRTVIMFLVWKLKLRGVMCQLLQRISSTKVTDFLQWNLLFVLWISVKNSYGNYGP